MSRPPLRPPPSLPACFAALLTCSPFTPLPLTHARTHTHGTALHRLANCLKSTTPEATANRLDMKNNVEVGVGVEE